MYSNHGLQQGSVIGDYTIVRQLGSGAFADVYLAQHTVLKTYVAIKVLKDFFLSQDDTKTFEAEARIVFDFRHENIVRILAYSSGIPTYMVMDYMSGGSLQEKYAGVKVPVEEVAILLEHIGSALQYAHDRKIIHRDVKPANILLDEDENYYLSDFGIARIAHRTISNNSINFAGTPAYVAPEQIAGKPEPRSDQYSLAIVAYELICGRKPFISEGLEVLFENKVSPPPPFSTFGIDLPSVEEVIMQALSKEADDRYESETEFYTAFQAAVEEDTNLRTQTAMNMPVQSAVLEEDIVTEPIQISRQDVSVQQARQDSFPASDIKFILWGSVLSLYFLASPIYLSWYAWYLWRGYWIWVPVALLVISALVIFFFSGNAVPKWKVTRWYTTIIGTLSSCLPTLGIWLAVTVHALSASIYGAIAIAAGIVMAINFLIGSLFPR